MPSAGGLGGPLDSRFKRGSDGGATVGTATVRPLFAALTLRIVWVWWRTFRRLRSVQSRRPLAGCGEGRVPRRSSGTFQFLEPGVRMPRWRVRRAVGRLVGTGRCRREAAALLTSAFGEALEGAAAEVGAVAGSLGAGGAVVAAAAKETALRCRSAHSSPWRRMRRSRQGSRRWSQTSWRINGAQHASQTGSVGWARGGSRHS